MRFRILRSGELFFTRLKKRHIFASTDRRCLCSISQHVTRVTRDGIFRPPLLSSWLWRYSWQRSSSTAYQQRITRCAGTQLFETIYLFSITVVFPPHAETISCSCRYVIHSALKLLESKFANGEVCQVRFFRPRIDARCTQV